MSRVYFSLSLDPPSLSIYPLLPASFPWGHQSRRRRPLSRGRGGFKARFCARAAASSANITRPMGAKRAPCMAWRVQHVALTEGSKSGRECICTSITLKFLDFCRISYMQAHKGRWLLNSPLFPKCSTCLVRAISPGPNSTCVRTAAAHGGLQSSSSFGGAVIGRSNGFFDEGRKREETRSTLSSSSS